MVNVVVGLVEHTAVVFFDCCFILVEDGAFVDKNDRVPIARDGQVKGPSREYIDVEIIRWSPCIYWPCLPLPLASNNLHLHFVLIVDFDFICSKLLIGRRIEFILLSQVDPKLKAEGVLLSRGRDLGMDNSFSSSHPLNVAWTYFALVAFEVFMVEAAFEHVGHGLEASVRVIREPSRQPNSEEVEHEEGVQVFEVLVADDSQDSSSFALILPSWFEYVGHGTNNKIGSQQNRCHLYYNISDQIKPQSIISSVNSDRI